MTETRLRPAAGKLKQTHTAICGDNACAPSGGAFRQASFAHAKNENKKRVEREPHTREDS